MELNILGCKWFLILKQPYLGGPVTLVSPRGSYTRRAANLMAKELAAGDPSNLYFVTAADYGFHGKNGIVFLVEEPA